MKYIILAILALSPIAASAYQHPISADAGVYGITFDDGSQAFIYKY